MKRTFWLTTILLAFIAAFAAVAQFVAASRELASFFPDDALLYLQAKDFGALLKDWNNSEEKRRWIKGSDYESFSRSRLFQRLGGAQSEFATAATIATDVPFLSSVAGRESGLALYDIGNLEFVYVTHMSEAQAQTTPLWQVRDKFELRTEGGAQFYVREDQQSNRTAAFAVRNGWLILGTRADLVAGVLDRMQLAATRGLPDEPWYADAVKQAQSSSQDLRMVLNLERIVPSPYFRSYWVQRNVTEMKQYRAAICDMHRGSHQYIEDRLLLRKTANNGPLSEGAASLMVLVPSDAIFASAQMSPSMDRVISEMRENVLELRPAQAQAVWSAPANVSVENTGNASQFEERIDAAPVIAKQTNPYQPLSILLGTMQPAAMLKTYVTRAKPDAMFVGVDSAIVLQAASSWSEEAVKSALVSAIRPALTVSQLGVSWISHSGEAGSYATLDGQISLAIAVRKHLLYLSTSAPLMQEMLAKDQQSITSDSAGVTYIATFRHASQEQQAFQKIAARLDAGHGVSNGQAGAGDSPADTNGGAPAFFSGNAASLSKMFGDVTSERVEERDKGAQVEQKVIYEWSRP
jgi:hypothetical protein